MANPTKTLTGHAAIHYAEARGMASTCRKRSRSRPRTRR